MKVLYCAYRDWAKDMFLYSKHNSFLYDSLDVDWKMITTTNELLSENLSEYELIFFIGWSEIIPSEIVNNNFCICLHPSPLPKYRGGSPIQHQIINGETESAVTFFKMTDKLDAGPILQQEIFELSGDLTQVLSRIKNLGSVMVRSIIYEYQKGTLKLTEQDESQATFYKRRTPKQSEITLDELMNSTAVDLHNKIRALQDPYPNAYIKLNNGEKLYLKESCYKQ